MQLLLFKSIATTQKCDICGETEGMIRVCESCRETHCEFCQGGDGFVCNIDGYYCDECYLDKPGAAESDL